MAASREGGTVQIQEVTLSMEVRAQVEPGRTREDPYGLAARVYRELTCDGWDRDEAAEMVDWLLGQGRTSNQKVKVLRSFMETNDMATNGDGE